LFDGLLKVSHRAFILPLQGSISSTFYMQLLHAQIPNAQKIQGSCQSFLALLGSAHVKSVGKMLVKSAPGRRFAVQASFYACMPHHY